MLKNIPLAMRNLVLASRNHVAKLYRGVRRRYRCGAKLTSEAGKSVRGKLRHDIAIGRETAQDGYRVAVRATRSVRRLNEQWWSRLQREIEASRHLRKAARGSEPIIVGPWLSEVGYEALYWIPFLRWVCDRHRIDRSRLVVVSRGGVGGWYHELSDRYVELFELFAPGEFVSLNATRYASGDQKQHAISAFDADIIARVRERHDLRSAGVCHPSVMFRLLRQFWLGNESLDYVQRHLVYGAVSPPVVTVPPLPERFTAVKLYTGKALPDTPENRRLLGALVERLAAKGPVVTLDVGVSFDEHEDYRFRDMPNVTSAAEWLTPANNLAVQTEVIRRAERFVGTCGSITWLAPLIGTPTVAVYSDDEFLGPHLYAARAAYRSMSAAAFAPVDLRALAHIDLLELGKATG